MHGRSIALAITLLIDAACCGASLCVRSGASGDDSGSDWDNAFPTFPNTLTRGNAYYVADGSYGVVVLDDAASGTDWIYVIKATDAAHGIAAGWASSYGDGVAEFTEIEIRTAYWDIDGKTGVGSEPRGFKVTYAGLYGAVWSSSTTPANKHHIAVRNLEAVVNDPTTNHACGVYFFLSESEGSLESPNLLVENTYFHDFGALFTQQLSGSYLVYRSNYWDTCAMADSAKHKEMAKWDSTNSHVRIYGNVFKDWQGYSVTGGLVLGGGGVDGSMTDWLIYNNVFYWTDRVDPGGVNVWNGGSRAIGGLDSSDTDHDGVYVFNNTFYNITDTTACNIFQNGTWTGDNAATNNLFVSCAGLADIVLDHDFNAYYDCTNFSDIEANELELVTNPLAAPPGNMHLLSGSPAINAGADLSSLFTTDITGKTRTGDWDIGAYEYGRLLRTTTLRAGNVTGP
jgi:hypothetical protein